MHGGCQLIVIGGQIVASVRCADVVVLSCEQKKKRHTVVAVVFNVVVAVRIKFLMWLTKDKTTCRCARRG